MPLVPPPPLLLAAAAVVSGAAAELQQGSPAAAWVQPRFLLSMWYDPVVPASEFPARYREIRDANMTVVMGGFGARNASMVQAQLAAAEPLGLGVVAAATAGISGYGGSKALWGYQLKDEPHQQEFEGLAGWTRTIGAAHPHKLRFINLLPNCPLATCLNASSYPEYVSRYVSVVKPDVLCMDAYPNFAAANLTTAADAYLFVLAVLRANALESSLNFWNFFGTQHVFGDSPDPSEAQIRWQAFTSLAMGAKGLLYYCWHGGLEFPGGVLAPRAPLAAFKQWRPGDELALTDHYDHVKRESQRRVRFGS